MLEQEQNDIIARLCATLEEELGAFRRFAHVPAVEIEDMAARLARAITPYVVSEDVSRAA